MSGFRLIDAIAAARRPKDLAVAVLGGLLGAGALGLAGGWLYRGGAVAVLGLCMLLLAIAILFISYAAVSARFTDEARLGTPRDLAAALVSALWLLPKAVLTALLLVLLLIVEFIAAALLLLICQIPQLGPALAFVIVPIIAALLGVSLYALLFIAAPLSVCALTQDRSVLGAVAFVLATVRGRLFDVVIRGTLLVLIVAAVAMTFGLIASLGLGATASVQSAVRIGSNYAAYDAYSGGYGDQLGSLLAMSGLGSAFASLRGVLAGGGVLFGFAGAVCLLIYSMGWSLIYAELDRELDTAGAEAALQQQYAKARDKARQMQEAAQQKARELQERRPGRD